MREIVLDTETTGLDPLAGHRVVEVGCRHIAPQFFKGDQESSRIGASRYGHQHVIPWPDQPRLLDCSVHGGAGWTRTSDNAIMSRALYHLSYGTAQAGRDRRALEGEDPILRFVPAP